MMNARMHSLIAQRSSQRMRQGGFAAIAAIFIIVILAALGAFMVTFSNTQQLTSAQDVQGSRAYWAANAGLDWVVGSVAANAACPTGAAPSFDGDFIVAVTCLEQSYTEAGLPLNIFSFIAVARSPGAVGSLGYIERSVSASMEK